MFTRISANKSNEYILDKCFIPLEEFPFEILPTSKQVLERCLYFKYYRKDGVQREVSEKTNRNGYCTCKLVPETPSEAKSK